MELKRCIKCGNEYPKTTKYFGKLSKSKDGFRNECKECRKQYAKENASHIKEYKRKYHIEHQDEILSNVKKWYKENTNKVKEYKKLYRIEHKEEITLKDHEKYLKNKIQHYKHSIIWNKNNKDKVMSYKKKYKHSERGKEVSLLGTQKRRVLKMSLPYNYSVEEWNKCKEYFNNTCAYCGNEVKLTQDHWIPLSKGGEYTKDNIICACLSCNSSKRDYNPFEWYIKQPFYSKEREQKILKYLNYKNKIQQLTLTK